MFLVISIFAWPFITYIFEWQMTIGMLFNHYYFETLVVVSKCGR